MANLGRINISIKTNKEEQNKIKNLIDSKRIPIDSLKYGYYKFNEEKGCFIEEEKYNEDGSTFIFLEGRWHIPKYFIDELINIGIKNFIGNYYYEMEYRGEFEVKDGVFREISRTNI